MLDSSSSADRAKPSSINSAILLKKKEKRKAKQQIFYVINENGRDKMNQVDFGK